MVSETLSSASIALAVRRRVRVLPICSSSITTNPVVELLTSPTRHLVALAQAVHDFAVASRPCSPGVTQTRSAFVALARRSPDEHERARALPAHGANRHGEDVLARGERDPHGRRHLRAQRATLRPLELHDGHVVHDVVADLGLSDSTALTRPSNSSSPYVSTVKRAACPGRIRPMSVSSTYAHTSSRDGSSRVRKVGAEKLAATVSPSSVATDATTPAIGAVIRA